VEEFDDVSLRVLSAARDVFVQAGIQRSTMDDVAKAAGVSRITVYRRFSTKDILVDAVVRWEFRQYFTQFLEDIKAAHTVADRVVVGFVSSLRRMRGNSLIGGLLTAEPGSLVPSMVGRQGQTFANVREFVADQLRSEQKAGNVASDLDVVLVADMLVRVSTSFLVAPSDIVDLDDDERIAALARQFLVPMLNPPGSVRMTP